MFLNAFPIIKKKYSSARFKMSWDGIKPSQEGYIKEDVWPGGMRKNLYRQYSILYRVITYS